MTGFWCYLAVPLVKAIQKDNTVAATEFLGLLEVSGLIPAKQYTYRKVRRSYLNYPCFHANLIHFT